MQGTPPPQQIIPEPSKVALKHGDGPDVWSQIPNQGQNQIQGQYQIPSQGQYQIPPQGQYQIPIQPGMAMGYYPETNATLALVLSVLGIVGCSIVTAIPGLIMANTALQTTNAIPGHPDLGIAKAAQVIAWISIGLAILGLFFYGAMFAVILATGGF